MLGSFLGDLIERPVRALERAGANYALIGGTALLLQGRDRNTRDVDVVAELPRWALGLARVLLELVAFRPLDCVHLLRLCPDLDRRHIEAWVARLGLETRWAEVQAI